MPLMQAESVKVLLPYDDGRVLEKSSVKILDSESGLIELTISDFELQGLKVGQKQSFAAKVFMKSGDVYSVLFSGGLNIAQNGDKKVWV